MLTDDDDKDSVTKTIAIAALTAGLVVLAEGLAGWLIDALRGPQGVKGKEETKQ